MIDPRDIRWLAGLLEGEGCFLYHSSPAIVLNMKDKDVVERAAVILGNRSVRMKTPPAKPQWNQTYTCAVYGARAAGWMMTLYGLMGVRRKDKIKEVLARWRIAKRGLPVGRYQFRAGKLTHVNRDGSH